MSEMDLARRNAEMRLFFTRKTEGYDDVHGKMMDAKRVLTDFLPDGVKTVLDLGAGTGLELIPLFARFPHASVTAIDLTESMLDVLRTRPFADRVTTVCGDFFTVDFGGTYDAVISAAALHHFSPVDKLRLYRSIRAALRPDGVFLNSDKVAASAAASREAFSAYFENPAKYPHMDTPLSVEEELDLLREAGFVETAAYPLSVDAYQLFSAKNP